MDGFELCQTLKDDYHIPVIMLTARDALSDKERAFLSGTDDYVTKPFEVKNYYLELKAVLRRYQINADNEVTTWQLNIKSVLHKLLWVQNDESSKQRISVVIFISL